MDDVSSDEFLVLMSSYGHLMSKLTFLAVFGRRGEFMDDSPATYESHPRDARDQWLEAHSLYDWFVAMWQKHLLGRVQD
jgi:hypothetical protein